MTPQRRNIIIGITVVIIIAIVVAMINTASSDENTGTANNGNVLSNFLGNTPTPQSITMDYYETMIDVIMTSSPYPAGPHQTYNDYPKTGYFETLNPLFYSGDRFEFDNVVNKRMLKIIPMKKPEYLINGEVTEPGALLDAYVEVEGTLYIGELTDLFNDYKSEYLNTI